MKRWPLFLLAITACAPVESQVPPRFCDASGLDDLIGKAATSPLGVDALRRSHSGTIRWLRPGAMATMDFRQDRLNIAVDAKNVVTGFKCG
jgi:hypothetical protein